MLIWQNTRKNHVLELHHLGNLSLRFSARNPNPQHIIPNWETEVDIGPIHTDEYLHVDIQHDFYYTYEKFVGRRGSTERVSFKRPVSLLRGGISGLEAKSRGLVPTQHPAVTNADYDFDFSIYNIPSGLYVFFGWTYVKRQQKNSVIRYVTNPDYGYMIEEGLEKDVKLFLPCQLIDPLMQNAPSYVLDVLDLLNKV